MDKTRNGVIAGTALNFKMGKVANLAAQSIAPGTIYVTTDERSMYVDLDDKRIRLGDFNVYNTIEELQGETHFSETSLYYVKGTGILYACISATTDHAQLKPINDVNDLRSAVGDLTSVVENKLDAGTYNEDKEALNTRLGGIDDAIKGLEEMLGGEDSGESDNTIFQRVAKLESDTNGLITTTIPGMNTVIDQKVNNEDFETFQEENTEAINKKADQEKLTEEVNRAKGVEEGLQSAIDTINNTTIPGMNTVIEQKANINDVHSWIGEVTVGDNGQITIGSGATAANTVVDFIDKKFVAFNAMTFKGSVESYSDLPLAVNAGDTWLLSKDNAPYSAGDLFVANIDGEANWTHVPSGYNSIYEQKLVGDAEGNQILLRNERNTELTTAITVASEGSIETSISNGDSPTLTVKMVWGSF